jgi:hypothetical protein
VLRANSASATYTYFTNIWFKTATAADAGRSLPVFTSTSIANSNVLALAGSVSIVGGSLQATNGTVFSTGTFTSTAAVRRFVWWAYMSNSNNSPVLSVPAGVTALQHQPAADTYSPSLLGVVGAGDAAATAFPAITSTGSQPGGGHGYYIAVSDPSPTAPGAFTSPTAGKIVGSTDTVAAPLATDANNANSTLTHTWELTLNGGTTWTSKRSVTNDVPSWTYDYAADAETTQAQWRVRAFDGIQNGPYSYSDVFRIHRPIVPNAPTALTATPSTVNIGDVVRIGWTYSDAGDPNPDPQLKYQLRWRKVE